ncbi:MAG: EAL domain-containing protein [Rhodobacteraceae bacterium]|nr:EAL domain-containing protein [Paracoccaceae bacterium]
MKRRQDKKWTEWTDRLRFKMTILGVAFAALFVLFTTISVREIKSVAESISLTDKVTGPLYVAALNGTSMVRSLSDASRSIVVNCMRHDQVYDVDGARLEDAGLGHLIELTTLAAHSGVAELGAIAGRVENVRQNMLQQRDLMIEQCNQYAGWYARHSSLKLLARDQLVSLQAQLSSLISLLDMRISSQGPSGASAKLPTTAQPETSAAPLGNFVFKDWSVLRSLYSIRTLAIHLINSLEENGASIDRSNMVTKTMLERGYIRLLRMSQRKLALQLDADGKSSDSASMFKRLDELTNIVEAGDGLHVSRALGVDLEDALATSAEEFQSQLSELETYMIDFSEQAGALNQTATMNMNARVTQAVMIIGSASLILALIGVVGVVIFGVRLTRPIEMLTAHARQIQNTARTDRPVPAPLLARHDEIGSLARSFDELMRVLNHAREELLDASRAEVRQQYERLKTALDSFPQGVCLTDQDKNVLMINDQFRLIYGIGDVDVPEGMSVLGLMRLCRERGAKLEMTDAEIASNNLDLNFYSRKPRTVNFADGRVVVVKTVATPEGGGVSISEDITERKRQEDRIAHLAHHDPLTGLSNRVSFRHEVEGALHTLGDGGSLALLYLDLDEFKSVNDTLGHPVGDELLVAVSERLKSGLSKKDNVARLGGDEFAVLLADISGFEEVSAIAARLIETVGEPYMVSGNNIVIGVSIGIAMVPEDGETADLLMKNADMALYSAKLDGKNRHRFFEPEMNEHMQKRRQFELDLRAALDSESFQLHYQPLLDLDHDQIVGFEALLRWQHPELGYVSPAEFIPIAEEAGLIEQIGAWVLNRACRDASTWPETFRVAVNISPLQFKTGRIGLDVMSAISATGLNPNRLELEITEGVLLQDTDSTQSLLADLRRLGVRVVMDDFGTGYSSLSYLTKFGFDKVKIDQAFVRDIPGSEENLAVVQSVASLCKKLGISTTVEGVETADQFTLLKLAGCTQAQGYLIGRPMPLESVMELIETQNAPFMAARLG